MLTPNPVYALLPSTAVRIEAAPARANLYYQPADKAAIPTWLLLPGESTSLELQTHTANVQLISDGALRVQIEGNYRLYNPGKTTLISTVRLQPVAAPFGGPTVAPVDLTLLSDSQALVLQPDGSGGFSAQVQVEPDTRLALNVRYSHDLSANPLPTIYYALDQLAAWPGALSLGVTIALPDDVQAQSWVRIEPDGWAFTPSTNIRQPNIKWLYEAQLPDQPFVFQFVNPVTWQQIQEVEATVNATANPAPTPADFIRLGDLYRSLYTIAATFGDRETSEGFYARALAVYSTGLAQVPIDVITAEGNTLHVALAGLYRSRIVNQGNRPNEEYARLMLAEVEAALSGLPGEDARRRELSQWQAQGLRVLVDVAQARRDWPTALVYIEEMAKLPGDLVSPAELASERRAVIAQQALQLLEQDDSAGAIALAGTEILNTELLPAQADQSLFASWHSTVTIGQDATIIILTALPVTGRIAEAQKTLSDVVTQWATLSLQPGQEFTLQQMPAVPTTNIEAATAQLQIRLPEGSTGQTFAQALPQTTDMAFPRLLLSQIAPTVEQHTAWLWREVNLAQELDLRAAGDQWASIALRLEQDAARFIDQTTAEPAGALSVAEETLRAQIQAVNYRNTAQIWRKLAQNSTVTVALSAGGGVRTTTRVWLSTVTSAPQSLELHARFMDPVRLLGFLVTTCLALFLCAGGLWWLL